ncbi:MAG: hypothetical protein ABJP48_00880 [Erythrobacter sp.]
MTFAAQVLTIVVGLTLHAVLLVWLYHSLYRKSPTAVGKTELEWLIPAVIPVLMMALWLLGIVDFVWNFGFAPKDLWVWWIPIASLVVLLIGRRFARWNRSRLIEKGKARL